MKLVGVKYDLGRYEIAYVCRECGKPVKGAWKFCPNCSRQLVKDGRPDVINLDDGQICGLIALGIKNGAFLKNGLDFINKGANVAYEGPGHMGMMWADWQLERLEGKGEKA